MAQILTRRRISGARIAVCISLALGWVGTGLKVVGASRFEDPTRLAARLGLEPFLSTGGWLVLTFFFLVALAAFALRFHEGISGALAVLIVGMGTVVEVGMQRADSTPGFGKMLASAVICAWLVGWWVGRRGSAGRREWRANELACGIVAACLLAPALSKLHRMGFDWVDGPTHALLIYERSFLARLDWLVDFRIWYASHPQLCSWSAAFTLAVEACGWLFLIPRCRKIYAWVAAVMFVGIALTLGYHAGTWLLVLFGLSYSTLGSPPPKGALEPTVASAHLAGADG